MDEVARAIIAELDQEAMLEQKTQTKNGRAEK
jgi:hypothetical protein